MNVSGDMVFDQVSSVQNPQRILIVDDQPDNLRLLSKMLVDDGYDVRRALSGTLALLNVQSSPPDLILLDINMPELSGYDVCKTLKAEPKTRQIPIIFLSASNSETDKVQAFEMGGADYITKPFQMREVLARVATQLKLQQLNSLRENLSRMLVHDLRTPLSCISLCSSSLLRRSYLESKDQKILQTIYTTSQRLNHMLNDLLITAKLDAGQLVLNRTQVNLNELVQEAIAGLTFDADAKRVQLVRHLPDTSYEWSLDANLFRRVIENLLANAIKFSPMGGTVTIALERMEDTQQNRYTISLKVSDEGMGVPDDQRQTIFQPYETGQAIDGVSQIGLGLSFCKLVVDAHGGHISVEKNQPTGATFSIQMSHAIVS
ncbi:MAG: hybrid sensor histidine kinase/response regulator [Symploca sp. SIO2B6]|nr:hybrid sensor histidine kinase/response regulator [Symploca sp. SIO2B6]